MNKSDSQIWRLLRYQDVPARTFDLKGSGLQFPHEYVITVAEVLGELYPELEEETLRMKNLLNNLEVVQDNHTISVKRGLGLGYYTPLKCLAVWSMLQDYNILSSFDDDMLIDDADYEDCIEIINHFGLVINESKSGKLWNNVYWFIEAGISEDGLVACSSEQADISAIFRQRFHWERKLITSSLEHEAQFVVAYHLEKIYGYEFHECESGLSLEEGGYCTAIEPKFGMSRGLFATSFGHKPDKKVFDQIGDLFPTESYTLNSRKLIHNTRKERWKKRKYLHTDDSKLTKKIECATLRSEYFKYPDYAEKMLNLHNLTSNRLLQDVSHIDVKKSLLDFPSASEPLSWLQEKDPYEPRINTTVDPRKSEEYHKLMDSRCIDRRFLQRREDVSLDKQETKVGYKITVPKLESLGLIEQIISPIEELQCESQSSIDYESSESVQSEESLSDVDDMYLNMESNSESDSGSDSDEDSI